MSFESIKENAAELLRNLETLKRRDNDESTSFVRIKDGSPEWCEDVVREAHCKSLPCDERYRLIKECLMAIVDADSRYSIEMEADIATAELTGWLASSNSRHAYCDEAMNEGLYSPEVGNTLGLLAAGQTLEREEIMEVLLKELEKLP